jgi:two-component system OmpR family sensor kinase/two-component system sensor histidine kinase BaeS
MTSWRRTHWTDAPRWWPQDEPWPPRGPRAYREARRARFVRRWTWFSFLPVWGVFWLIAIALDHGRWSGLPFGVVPVLLLGAAFAAVVAVVVRRMAAPVAEIVSAAERIGQRDFKARITVPHGPAWAADTARAFNAMSTELEAQDAARRQMMADIAHELRTPLSVVQGKLEGLIDGVYPRDDERLQGLLDDTRVLARLVEDLRTLSTAESGALALNREAVDVAALIADALASLDAPARDAGVTLHADVSADPVEPMLIDPIRIREVLTNLVGNALRYTPRGGTVRVGLTWRDDGADIAVADTGSGISAEDLPRIFDRFYKGSRSSGSGLGLTIARNLVEAHGGRMSATSEPRRGTTITFSLPRMS